MGKFETKSAPFIFLSVDFEKDVLATRNRRVALVFYSLHDYADQSFRRPHLKAKYSKGLD